MNKIRDNNPWFKEGYNQALQEVEKILDEEFDSNVVGSFNVLKYKNNVKIKMELKLNGLET